MIAVHVADVFAHSLSPTLPEQAGIEMDLPYLTALGLDGRLEAWKERCIHDQTAGY